MPLETLLLILVAHFVATASPGPSTLTVAGTSMGSGRRTGLAIAAGIVTGSVTWSLAAAFGLGAMMLANPWLFEAMRYVGAAYLGYLGLRSARSAIRGSKAGAASISIGSARAAYVRGVGIHLTNPKVILFFGSLFSLGVPPDAPPTVLLIVVGAAGIQSAAIFGVYAVLFSSRPAAAAYARLGRWFDGAVAMLFCGAAVKLVLTRLPA